jgi:Zn-dependent peptidase ImmA (M78 family)
MNLSLYKATELEKTLIQKYKENGIKYASDMDIERIADLFSIEVRYYEGKPFAQWDDQMYSFIFLNAYMDEYKRREVFFHELSHPIQHAGNQKKMPGLFKDLQEIQAGHFQLYAAMPIYLLEEFNMIKDYSLYIKVVSEEFRLPIPFVQKRIEQVERRIVQERLDRETAASMKPVRVIEDYSHETKRILNQLQTQLRRKELSNG